MDRSFLSRPEVVEASRNFVCIRLATYEDAEEARFLATIFRGRSGQLENTVFALLSPDGKHKLMGAARGPNQLFGTPEYMAESMNEVARYYGARTALSQRQLPKVKDYTLALNIAACESVPLVVVTSSQAEAGLAASAWDPRNLGKAVYVRAQLEGRQGAFLVEPDKFGQKAVSIRELPDRLNAAQLASALQPYLGPPKNHREHVSEGHQRGVHWQTKIPVTDPHSRY